jgi:hypothetical protein
LQLCPAVFLRHDTKPGHAKTITITRGREHHAHYLSIKDDGDGVPRDDAGLPDFKYLVTHICDSIKRRRGP